MSSRDEAPESKSTESIADSISSFFCQLWGKYRGTERKGEKHFCSHAYSGIQNSDCKESSEGKPSRRDTKASGSRKEYGMWMKRRFTARRAFSTPL